MWVSVIYQHSGGCERGGIFDFSDVHCLPGQNQVSRARRGSDSDLSSVLILSISLAFRYIDSSHSSRSLLLQFPHVPD